MRIFHAVWKRCSRGWQNLNTGGDGIAGRENKLQFVGVSVYNAGRKIRVISVDGGLNRRCLQIDIPFLFFFFYVGRISRIDDVTTINGSLVSLRKLCSIGQLRIVFTSLNL